MFSVEQALTIAPLTQSKVVAGGEGLDRIIKNITIMEVPDLLQWLKGNDFVITSLFCIKDDPRAQVKLVQDMASSGCAALAIKSDRYVKTIPPEMIDAANSLSFPLLDIPKDITYIDIINPLMECLLDHTAGVLRQADMAFRWLQEVILNDQGLEAALVTLQHLLKCDLSLECPESGLVLTTSEDSRPFDPLPPAAFRQLNNTHQPFFHMRKRQAVDIPCLIIPIMARSSASAFLTIENYHKDQGLSPINQAILDHTIPLIGMEITGLHSRAIAERQQVNSFVEELITRDFKSEKAMLERGRYLGLNLSHPSLSIVFYLETAQKNLTEEKMQLLKGQLQRDLALGLRGKNIPFIAGLRNNSLIIITTWPAEQSKEQIAQEAYKLAQNIFLHLKWAFPTLVFTGGTGLPQQGIDNIAIGFGQALKAITLGRQAHGPSQVYSYDKLGVYRLLCSHPDKEELISLRDEILGPLADYDKKQNASYIETLNAYFYHNEDINDVAKALFIHPNTVRYRLERAASLLSRDLATTEHRFQVYLALKIAGLYPFDSSTKNENNT